MLIIQLVVLVLPLPVASLPSLMAAPCFPNIILTLFKGGSQHLLYLLQISCAPLARLASPRPIPTFLAKPNTCFPKPFLPFFLGVKRKRGNKRYQNQSNKCGSMVIDLCLNYLIENNSIDQDPTSSGIGGWVGECATFPANARYIRFPLQMMIGLYPYYLIKFQYPSGRGGWLGVPRFLLMSHPPSHHPGFPFFFIL